MHHCCYSSILHYKNVENNYTITYPIKRCSEPVGKDVGFLIINILSGSFAGMDVYTFVLIPRSLNTDMFWDTF